MKWKKPQLPMSTFLIIFKIQLYFVRSFSRNKSPEKRLYRSNSKKPKGRYAKFIFSVDTINVFKKKTVNR